MTDTPGREPEDAAPDLPPGERLPVPRPTREVAPVERFSSPPSARTVELTPERAAQVVRQSSNARWVGFLAVVVVILFVAIYWFYELGAPLGLTEPRLDAEVSSQQVITVERGYLVYEANCARCHGEQGEGGIGPILNRQDKLFQHLNEDYLRNILEVGGRYACGNPLSLMPVWADTGNPPGPLNYRQIEEVIAFMRAPSTQTFTVRDEERFDPHVDPVTGEVETFTGWVDPNYAPEPGATPYPSCWQDEFAAPSAAPSGEPGGSAAPSGSPGPGDPADPAATIVEIAAQNIAFDQDALTVPADETFVIRFANNDPGIPHNVEIKGADGGTVFLGEIFNGVETRDYEVPGLAAGDYTFICTVHPNMTGTLTAS
jgi:mono/diheme cytochrome c family protein/plastocyanin